MLSSQMNVLLNLSTDAFLIVDEKGEILSLNEKVYTIFGKSIKRGEKLSKVIPPHIESILKAYISKINSVNKNVEFYIDIKKSLYRCYLYKLADWYVLVFDDITEIVTTTKYTEDLEQKIDNAQQLAKIGYFEVLLQKNQFFFSNEVYNILGLEYSLCYDRDIVVECMYPRDVKKFNTQIENLIKSQKKMDISIRFIKQDTKDIINCGLKSDIIFDDGIHKIVGTIQDLTESAKNIGALKQAKRKAEKVSKERAYFIGQASHDLRQPIQAMRLNLYSLEKTKLNEAQKGIVYNIGKSVENLSHLLDNLIDVSRFDYSDKAKSTNKFDLNELVNKIADYFMVIADYKKINFEINSGKLIIDSSEFSIERMLRNLLSNAFKYTKDKVVLNVFEKDDNIIISVSDNGYGIKKRDLKHIFDDFFRSSNIPNNNEGIGLGLSIVKKIAKTLNAKIDVKTKENEGSEFIVTLPIKKA